MIQAGASSIFSNMSTLPFFLMLGFPRGEEWLKESDSDSGKASKRVGGGNHIHIPLQLLPNLSVFLTLSTLCALFLFPEKIPSTTYILQMYDLPLEHVTPLKRTNSLSPKLSIANSSSARGSILCPPPCLYTGIILTWGCSDIPQAVTADVSSYKPQPSGIQRTLYLWSHLPPPPPRTLIIFPPPLLQQYLNLDIDAPVRAEPSTVFYSMYLNQLCVSVLMTISCKNMSAALIWVQHQVTRKKCECIYRNSIEYNKRGGEEREVHQCHQYS